MDNGPEIEIELYDTPTKAPIGAGDKASRTAPAVLATAATFLVAFALYFGRLGARVLADAAAEAARTAPPPPVPATVPAAGVTPALTAQLAAVGLAPELPEARDPLTEARAARDVAVTARAAWEQSDLRWVAHPRAGWAAFEGPYIAGRWGNNFRSDVNAAGARWDGRARWYECREAQMSAVAAVIERYYGRPVTPFADVPRATAAETPARGPAVEMARQTAPEAPSLAPRVAGIDGLAAASRERRARGESSRASRAPSTNGTALAALDRAIGSDTLTADEREAAARDVAVVAGALRDGELVAGARVEGQGVMVGWTGRREATRAQLRAVLATAEAPADWAPKSKSAKAQLGAAVGKLSREGLIPRVARDVTEQERRRGVSARWIIGTANMTGQAGDALGRIALTVELVNDAPRFDGDATLAAEVRAEYDRLTDGELYAAADVTAWLAHTLREHMGAVRLGGQYYVRAQHAALAERLCQALADGSASYKGWGADWLLPALPVATSAQLRAGLARGLITEARDVLDDLERQRETARKAKREDIGTRAAATLLGRLRTVSERAAQYAVILGAEHFGTIRQEIAAALAIVEPLCDDTSQRGAMLEYD